MANEADDTKAITSGEYLDVLIGRGFSPETIIDVGVATGTPDIYKRFPDAYYFLFEPLSVWQEGIAVHLRRLKGKHLKVAAGDEAIETRIYVSKNARPGGASLVYKSAPEDTSIVEDVSVRRLDQQVDKADLGRHTFLKTDCQGFDARALIGAEGLLDKVALIQAETNFQIPKDQLSVFEVMPLLRHYGLAWLARSCIFGLLREHVENKRLIDGQS